MTKLFSFSTEIFPNRDVREHFKHLKKRKKGEKEKKRKKKKKKRGGGGGGEGENKTT